MKTKQWMGILFASLAILSGCTTNNRGVVEHPAFIARNTTLEINKVELSDTATVLYMKAFYPPGNWIKPDSNTFLTDNEGKKYTILSSKGISMAEQFIMPNSGEADFSLIFPPVAPNATFVDYSEGDYNGAWKIWGIQLTNKPIKVNLPNGFKDVAIDKNAVLPPVEFKTGKAHIEGQILNYRSGMPTEIPVFVYYPFDTKIIRLTIDSIGKFFGDIDAYSVHPATVLWLSREIRCFIAPAETTSLVLNPSSRKGLHEDGNNSSQGEPVYYGGFLASVSKEFVQIDENLYMRQSFDSYESYRSFIQFVGEKTPEALKESFLNEYQTKKAALDTLDVSPACKQLLHCALDLSYASNITTITYSIDRAFAYNHQSDKAAVDKYYATRKFNLPEDFYDVLKDFPMINDSGILYVQNAGLYAVQWQMQNMQPVLSKALGTDSGTLFDLLKVIGEYNDIQNFKPVSEAQIGQLPASYQDFIRDKNNKLLQLIEANKGKTAFNEKDITKVANEDVFPFILSKFRGKPILVDFWATWCGPCKLANKELKPIEAELAKKGIVFVYVAGENSPLEDWKNMIPDLHGEHFRLTAKQWDYVCKTFGIDGVPTYFFVDSKGNIKERQVGYGGVMPMKEKMFQLK